MTTTALDCRLTDAQHTWLAESIGTGELPSRAELEAQGIEFGVELTPDDQAMVMFVTVHYGDIGVTANRRLSNMQFRRGRHPRDTSNRETMMYGDILNDAFEASNYLHSCGTGNEQSLEKIVKELLNWEIVENEDDMVLVVAGAIAGMAMISLHEAADFAEQVVFRALEMEEDE